MNREQRNPYTAQQNIYKYEDDGIEIDGAHLRDLKHRGSFRFNLANVTCHKNICIITSLQMKIILTRVSDFIKHLCHHTAAK